MGLLSKAAGKTDTEKSPINENISIDEMGKSLASKIKNLPQSEDTPYTALSLLKAYSNFHSGFCLSLEKGVYSSYASLGTGIDKLSIPQEKVWTNRNAKLEYFPFELVDHDDFSYWVFPLAPPDQGPWKAIMILEAENNPDKNASFRPELIAQIINGISDRLCGQAKAAVYSIVEDFTEVLSEAEPVLEDTCADSSVFKEIIAGDQQLIKQKIADFQKNNSSFTCIVYDGSKDEPLEFSRKIMEMINTLGSVIPLSPAIPLILLPKTLDSELIIDVLKKTVNSTPLLTFESNSVESTLNRIQPFIENGSGKDLITFKI